MKENAKKRKRLYIVLSVIVLILIAGILVIDQILDGIIKKEVASQLNKNPNSLYTLSFEDVKVNIFTGSLKITNISITPTDSASTLLHEGKLRKLVQSHIPLLRIKNLKILKFIQDKFIDISEIDISGFSVDYLINPEAERPENKNTFAINSILSDKFQGARIEGINVNAETVRFYHVDRKDSTFFELDSLHLYISYASISPESLKKPIPVEFSDIQINTGHFSLNSMKYYSIYTSDIKLDVEEAALIIEGFKLEPKFSKEEFNRQIKYNTDWFSISTQSIRFSGLSLDELEFDELLSFNSVAIEGAVIDIYRDKRLPDAPFKYKPLLGGLVQKIPLAINIDTLSISGNRLQYEERTDASDMPGTVFFEPLSVTAIHVTNDSALIAENPIMEVNFQGKIMAQGNLAAALLIDLTSNYEEFDIRGSLEPVSGSAFNPMVENLLPVSITSADISRTEFSFSANDDISRGELIMEYDNLKVEVIKGKENDKKAGLISVVANGLIKGKNSPDQGKYHTGNIRFERRKDKAIVNYLWNSCKTGIISIVAPIADHTKKDERKEIREEKKGEKKEEKKKERKQK